MSSLFELFPDPDQLLKLVPEELAPVLLKLALPRQQSAGFIPHAVTEPSVIELHNGKAYPIPKAQMVDKLVNSAWRWLEREGFIDATAGINGDNGWKSFTQRGLNVANGQDFSQLRMLAEFPKALLHPTIRDAAWSALIRSTNATAQTPLVDAVRDAFIKVEEAVRAAGGYLPKDFGEPLMTKAFEPDTGPMGDRDTTKPKKERLGRQTFFIGAMNTYRNPIAHRHIRSDLSWCLLRALRTPSSCLSWCVTPEFLRPDSITSRTL
ncbi:TIGR02391 family protein [Bradyrhizobium sp. AZCC 1693]|uniref:TIGR02391 family protein n=1 Tax=Bradyrhizobium sp. AZCC 1693 TaxID=3117029 RepID=UPI002FF30C92